MSILEKIEAFKKSGNGFYQRSRQKVSSSLPLASSGRNKEDRETFLRLACLEYGKGLEEILKYEEDVMRGENETMGSSEYDLMINQLLVYKQQYYLNLGMMNFFLGDSNECRKCCNISLLFCNHFDLFLSDLVNDKQQDKISTFVSVLQPVSPMFKKHIAKVLYWRAKALHSLGDKSLAISDLQEASGLEPQDQKIQCLLKEFEDSLKIVQKIEVEVRDLNWRAPEGPYDLTVNGGWCLQRSGYWSQSVSEVLVYLPTHYLQLCIHSELPEFKVTLPLRKLDLSVQFHSQSISILKQPQHSQCLVLSLMNPITPMSCTWALESHNACQYLVLYLTKSSNFSANPTPGMEWWECVCEDDERIDTLLCNVGSNISELPSHARDRAELEHQRYQSLSAEEQEKERQYLIQMKGEFSKSMERTQSDREREEATMREVPERAEFLRKLRSEFPQIDFVSK